MTKRTQDSSNGFNLKKIRTEFDDVWEDDEVNIDECLVLASQMCERTSEAGSSLADKRNSEGYVSVTLENESLKKENKFLQESFEQKNGEVAYLRERLAQEANKYDQTIARLQQQLAKKAEEKRKEIIELQCSIDLKNMEIMQLKTQSPAKKALLSKNDPKRSQSETSTQTHDIVDRLHSFNLDNCVVNIAWNCDDDFNEFCKYFDALSNKQLNSNLFYLKCVKFLEKVASTLENIEKTLALTAKKNAFITKYNEHDDNIAKVKYCLDVVGKILSKTKIKQSSLLKQQLGVRILESVKNIVDATLQNNIFDFVEHVVTFLSACVLVTEEFPIRSANAIVRIILNATKQIEAKVLNKIFSVYNLATVNGVPFESCSKKCLLQELTLHLHNYVEFDVFDVVPVFTCNLLRAGNSSLECGCLRDLCNTALDIVIFSSQRKEVGLALCAVLQASHLDTPKTPDILSKIRMITRKESPSPITTDADSESQTEFFINAQMKSLHNHQFIKNS